jgi:hypothetical protein
LLCNWVMKMRPASAALIAAGSINSLQLRHKTAIQWHKPQNPKDFSLRVRLRAAPGSSQDIIRWIALRRQVRSKLRQALGRIPKCRYPHFAGRRRCAGTRLDSRHSATLLARATALYARRRLAAQPGTAEMSQVVLVVVIAEALYPVHAGL